MCRVLLIFTDCGKSFVHICRESVGINTRHISLKRIIQCYKRSLDKKNVRNEQRNIQSMQHTDFDQLKKRPLPFLK